MLVPRDMCDNVEPKLAERREAHNKSYVNFGLGVFVAS